MLAVTSIKEPSVFKGHSTVSLDWLLKAILFIVQTGYLDICQRTNGKHTCEVSKHSYAHISVIKIHIKATTSKRLCNKIILGLPYTTLWWTKHIPRNAYTVHFVQLLKHRSDLNGRELESDLGGQWLSSLRQKHAPLPTSVSRRELWHPRTQFRRTSRQCICNWNSVASTIGLIVKKSKKKEPFAYTLVSLVRSKAAICIHVERQIRVWQPWVYMFTLVSKIHFKAVMPIYVVEQDASQSNNVHMLWWTGYVSNIHTLVKKITFQSIHMHIL